MLLYFDAIFFIVWSIASIVTIIRRGEGTVYLSYEIPYYFFHFKNLIKTDQEKATWTRLGTWSWSLHALYFSSSILRESTSATWRTSPNLCRTSPVFSFSRSFPQSSSRWLLFFQIFSPTRFAKQEQMTFDADLMPIRWLKEFRY